MNTLYRFVLMLLMTLMLISCGKDDDEDDSSGFGVTFGSGKSDTTSAGNGQDTYSNPAADADGGGGPFGGKDGGAQDTKNLDMTVNDISVPLADTEDTDPIEPQDSGGAPIDVPFEDPDTGCTPNCEERVCGPDGCGSICGYCQYGTACNDVGACIPVCDPVTPCQGKKCGPDNCGGTCGTCDPSFACGDDGLCYESACEPQCEGKQCGPDGCGGVCGTCKGTKLCDIDIGECVSNPCGSVGFKGACLDKHSVIQCVSGQLETTNCTTISNSHGCVWNAFFGKYECGKPPACLPDCIEAGKQCGDGGCNYSCGDCFKGWSCINFKCQPEAGGACGTIPTIGICVDNKNYFCANAIINVEDCNAVGKTCKYDPVKKQNMCK
ncbi:MAG: hypothetical protein HUU55_09135 [Myxococcales bacterium]|nr:hypothetical protein [Myxococcales bacterium]